MMVHGLSTTYYQKYLCHPKSCHVRQHGHLFYLDPAPANVSTMEAETEAPVGKPPVKRPTVATYERGPNTADSVEDNLPGSSGLILDQSGLMSMYGNCKGLLGSK
jgi:hypothetical protein